MSWLSKYSNEIFLHAPFCYHTRVSSHLKISTRKTKCKIARNSPSLSLSTHLQSLILSNLFVNIFLSCGFSSFFLPEILWIGIITCNCCLASLCWPVSENSFLFFHLKTCWRVFFLFFLFLLFCCVNSLYRLWFGSLSLLKSWVFTFLQFGRYPFDLSSTWSSQVDVPSFEEPLGRALRQSSWYSGVNLGGNCLEEEELEEDDDNGRDWKRGFGWYN